MKKRLLPKVTVQHSMKSRPEGHIFKFEYAVGTAL